MASEIGLAAHNALAHLVKLLNGILHCQILKPDCTNTRNMARSKTTKTMQKIKEEEWEEEGTSSVDTSKAFNPVATKLNTDKEEGI